MKTIKIKKNIFMIAILFSLFFASIIPVNAASFALGTTHGTTDPNSLIVTENRTITVSNVPTGDTLSAYKIMDAFYNQTTNALYYEFTSDFKNYLASTTEYRNLTVDGYAGLTSGNITNGSTVTTSTLDRLASGYAGYIRSHSINGTDLTVSSTNRTANLPIGSYLIIPKTTSKIYAVMVGNLSLSEENGNWVANNQSIVAKVSDPGIVTKTIAGNKETDSAFIGREFTYNITGTVPKYPSNATNKKYTITDTMSNGLTFSGITNMTFQDGTTRLTVNANGSVVDSSNNVVANVTFNNQIITIDFNLDYVNSTEITITYKAQLNEHAVIGGEGNDNSAKLVYSNDPYSNSTYESESSKTTMYTYGIEILKYSGVDKSLVLADAIFDVYSNSSLTTKVGSITTNANGLGTLKGLPQGTYYLKETKAPSGHTLLGDPITINVGGTNSTESTTNPGYYYIEIANNKNMFLPFTGGMGTYAYTLIGLLIIVVAVIIFIIYRKRREKKEHNEE